MQAAGLRMRTAVSISGSPAGNILVIGIGNEYAQDDAAGLLVARKLREEVPDNIRIIESGGEGASLIEAWKSASSAIVIDGVLSGAGLAVFIGSTRIKSPCRCSLSVGPLTPLDCARP